MPRRSRLRLVHSAPRAEPSHAPSPLGQLPGFRAAVRAVRRAHPWIPTALLERAAWWRVPRLACVTAGMLADALAAIVVHCPDVPPGVRLDAWKALHSRPGHDNWHIQAQLPCTRANAVVQGVSREDRASNSTAVRHGAALQQQRDTARRADVSPPRWHMGASDRLKPAPTPAASAGEVRSFVSLAGGGGQYSPLDSIDRERLADLVARRGEIASAQALGINWRTLRKALTGESLSLPIRGWVRRCLDAADNGGDSGPPTPRAA